MPSMKLSTSSFLRNSANGFKRWSFLTTLWSPQSSLATRPCIKGEDGIFIRCWGMFVPASSASESGDKTTIHISLLQAAPATSTILVFEQRQRCVFALIATTKFGARHEPLNRCMDGNWVTSTLVRFKPLLPEDCRLYRPMAHP